MPPVKVGLGIDVLTAARQRIAETFDAFERIYVSFSGGKDSTVMLHLVMVEAARRGRRVGVLFIDWEAQYRATIEHVAAMFDLYREHVEPFWCCVPLVTTNACSQFEPEWTCWDPAKRDLWVRGIPLRPEVVTSLPCHYDGITFEEFAPAFGQWYSQGRLTACFVGIRAGESLNRWRTIAGDKSTFQGRQWTTWMSGTVYNAYPLYDWSTEDIWAYNGRTEAPYNRVYDLMHQAGLKLSQMRICEPYGDEQRRGLWLYHLLEPETWGKVVARVAGAGAGALYGKERGNVLGNVKVELPPGHSWKSFAEMLLSSMPPATADHYRDKIAVYLRWWVTKGGLQDLPDEREGDTGAKDIASWRRICKVLLRNDYWCKGLIFSPTKAAAYERYRKVMKNRRAKWGIFA